MGLKPKNPGPDIWKALILAILVTHKITTKKTSATALAFWIGEMAENKLQARLAIAAIDAMMNVIQEQLINVG